jgi:DNA-binding transcriptional LysR family regulator
VPSGALRKHAKPRKIKEGTIAARTEKKGRIPMELRTLSYFLAVAREENMTEAANVLHVTQPTLSRQMADLEDELGKKLFTRTNRKTLLTEDGMHLRLRAEEILSLVDQTKDEIRESDDDISGCLHIGAAEADAMKRITSLFTRLHRRFPRLTINLFSGNIDTVEDRLAHGLLDFALILHPIPLDTYDYIRLPEKIQAGVLLRADNPLAKKKALTLEDLRGMPLLIPSRNSKNAYDLQAWSHGEFHLEDLDIRGTYDLINNTSTSYKAASPTSSPSAASCRPSFAGLAFVPLQPAYELPAYVIWKKYRLQSRASEFFLKTLRSEIEKETGAQPDAR